MKKKMINLAHLEGLLYEHDLEEKVSGENSKNPGTKFITGTVSIATDDECLNVVQVHYTYVTEKTAKGDTNRSYTTLKNIIDEKIGSVMKVGKENAAKLRVDSAIGLNDFYSDRNGTEELVSVKRNEGGFIHVSDYLSGDRNRFECDMVITNVRIVEGDEEKGTSDKAIVKGAIFDFRNALLPIELSAIDPGAIDYFTGLEASTSNPVFTKVWGNQISTTVVRKITEESAFGAPSVREVRSSNKDFIITGANPTTYEWGLEETMTNEDLTKAISEREVYLATIKKRRDEYKQSQNKAAANVAAPTASNFTF